MMANSPPVIGHPIGATNAPGVFGRDDDPAKFLIGKGRFERPSLSIPGGVVFTWPVGIEGIRVTGSATLAEHKFIGDNDVVISVMHLDDRRIEMSGMFPGITGQDNMFELLQVIRTPAKWKLLALPGIFGHGKPGFQVQQVVVENYSFDHAEDERNDSWVYSLSFRRTGVGRTIKPAKKTHPPVNPTTRKQKPSKSARTFTVKANYRTLRSIAKKVYGHPSRWNDIYKKNELKLQLLMKAEKFNMHQLPIKRLPLGMKLDY